MADEMQTNGNEVQQAVSAALEQQKKKKKKKRLIIFGVILALIVVIGVAGAGSDNGGSQPAEAGTNAAGQKVEEKASTDGTLGDYVCTFKSATKCKDWDNRDSVKIVYSFTNNSSNPSSFDVALDDNVYQDGIALESTFTSGSDDQILDVEIKPGITKEVTKVYVLRNSTSDLEIEVSELLSFSDDMYKTTVKF